jgi:rubrerythrin
VPGDGEARATEALLLDKMGARLAFERAGVRLYEALVSKRDGDPDPFPGAPSREDLQHLLDEEAEHFRMLSEAIRERGGDPTVVTPCANTEGVLGMGIQKVVTDPRMNLEASLEAILLAELADNEAWETLVAIADVAGEDALVSRFEKALEQEDEHLAKVRGWLATAAGLGERNGEASDDAASEKAKATKKRAR